MGLAREMPPLRGAKPYVLNPLIYERMKHPFYTILYLTSQCCEVRFFLIVNATQSRDVHETCHAETETETETDRLIVSESEARPTRLSIGSRRDRIVIPPGEP